MRTVQMKRALPPVYKQCTLEGITPDPSFDPVRRYIAGFHDYVKAGIGLVLVGPNGCGKSGAVAVVWNTAAQMYQHWGSKNMIWCRARDIALTYQRGLVDDRFDEPIDDHLEQARLLVIDELGRDVDIKDFQFRLSNLLGVRKDAQLVTCIMSNETTDGIKALYGAGVHSLLHRSSLVAQVDGDDRGMVTQ